MSHCTFIYSEITESKSGDKDTCEKTDVEEEDPLVDQGNNQYNHYNNYIIQRRCQVFHAQVLLLLEKKFCLSSIYKFGLSVCLFVCLSVCIQ